MAPAMRRGGLRLRVCWLGADLEVGKTPLKVLLEGVLPTRKNPKETIEQFVLAPRVQIPSKRNKKDPTVRGSEPVFDPVPSKRNRRL